MGTRSITLVYDNDLAIINLYRQYDGYPEGHGRELGVFLNSFDAITSGIRIGDERKTANGMGCLAAQMVAYFKKEVGYFYLMHPDQRDVGEEYVYHVFDNRIEVVAFEKTIFIGTWREFYEWCYLKSTEENDV